MWEATIDTLPDAVYIFGPDKRLKKINRAGDGIKIGPGVASLVRKRTRETRMMHANYSGQTTLRINAKTTNLEKDSL